MAPRTGACLDACDALARDRVFAETANALRKDYQLGVLKVSASDPTEAREWSGLYSIRLGTIAAAGHEPAGMRETVKSLSSRDPKELVTMWTFHGVSQFYVLFVVSETNVPLGCFVVQKRPVRSGVPYA